MSLLTKKDLLAKEQLPIEKVMINDSDYVLIKMMSALDKENFETSLTREVRNEKTGEMETKTATEGFRGKLLIRTVCDENGKLIFNQEDLRTLMNNMSAATMEIIFKAAQKQNKMLEEDIKSAEKNFVGGAEGDSTSGSAKD